MTNSLSITGKQWRLRVPEIRESSQLSSQLGLPEVMGKILVGRGVNNPKDALNFITPKFSDLPDPSHLLDMDAAVESIIKTINDGGKIAIFGDYDVDGGCASALLMRFFAALNVETYLYIPDRNSEGYGPNEKAFDDIKQNGCNLAITVDCGSMAFEPLTHAKKIGLDVIVTDHHQTKPQKPDSVAFINPNRVDETSNCTMLSGAGVAFYLAMAVRRKLRDSNFFNDKMPQPKIEEYLDLVAVSTICDMVPLTGVNRVLVQKGLKVLGTHKNQGFSALMQVAEVDEAPTTYHAGFVIGPRINAGGRVAECDLGANLLASNDAKYINKIAGRLNKLNEERKRIEAEVLEEAKRIAKDQITEETKAIILANQGWHAGVIGIVASRIKEVYNLPTFILAIDGDEAKGSGRSINGIDLGKALIDCGGLLVKGGGHKMAAGLTIKTENIEKFTKKLNELVSEQAMKHTSVDVFQPYISLDGHLSTGAVTEEFMQTIARLEPYGSGNSEPKFVFSNVKVNFAKAVGADGSHLQFSIGSGVGAPLRGIAFKAMETKLGSFIMQAQKSGMPVSVCGTLRPNYFNGRTTYQLQMADAFEGSWPTSGS